MNNKIFWDSSCIRCAPWVVLWVKFVLVVVDGHPSSSLRDEDDVVTTEQLVVVERMSLGAVLPHWGVAARMEGYRSHPTSEAFSLGRQQRVPGFWWQLEEVETFCHLVVRKLPVVDNAFSRGV